jgi:uncharacterized protein (DUF2267 family)
MRHDALIADVRKRWGVPLEEDAERLVEAVLTVLREQLDARDAHALAAALPAVTAAPLARMVQGATYDARSFAARVAVLAAIPLPAAVEGTQVALAALAETLPQELVVRVRKQLHPELARALAPRIDEPPPESPERHFQLEGPRTPQGTLATGRPGSEHPVAEARLETAHAHSVARSDAPHADSKLSTARGLTQERERESLAAGRPPGPHRPLSG